jgi:hypothetical protein
LARLPFFTTKLFTPMIAASPWMPAAWWRLIEAVYRATRVFRLPDAAWLRQPETQQLPNQSACRVCAAGTHAGSENFTKPKPFGVAPNDFY